jgi:hypothetical protein
MVGVLRPSQHKEDSTARSHSIGGLVVKLAVAIRSTTSKCRPAPGSIPGRCMNQLNRALSFAVPMKPLQLLARCLRDFFWAASNRRVLDEESLVTNLRKKADDLSSLGASRGEFYR